MATTTGSCWCGECTYSYTGQPAVKALCHCLSCRKVCGSTNTVNYAVPSANFSVTKGTPQKFSKEHEFGMTLTVFFCPKCGTTVWKEATGDVFKGLKLVQAGTLDDKTLLNDEVKLEFYTTERVPWLHALEGATQAQ
ncbi:Mss4-like protein, partial [Xylogone sp. PMI_703]